MRDNFRPNVRLTTNILMVIGTFLIAFNLGLLNKNEKDFYRIKADCAKVIGNSNIDLYRLFIEKYDLKDIKLRIDIAIENFCDFYK